MQMGKQQLGSLTGVKQKDSYYELHYQNNLVARLYLVDQGIFRFILDPSGQFAFSGRFDPANYDNAAFQKSRPRATNDAFIVQSGSCQLIFGLRPATLTIFDESIHHNRLAQVSPWELGPTSNSEFLTQQENEFYFGTGLQNGSFSQRGRKVKVQADKISGPGGNLSPSSFFWSTNGFGEFRPSPETAVYDFGESHPGAAILTQDSPVIDIFYLLGNSPSQIIDRYYQLIGRPLMLPQYLLKMGYADNFTSIYWQPAPARNRQASKFEDGNYSPSKAEASGKSSLNGEEKYQFSARALIDRFQKHSLQLGYLLPNMGSDAVDPEAAGSLAEYANIHGLACGFKNKVMPNSEFSYLPDPSADQIAASFTQLQKQLNRKRPLLIFNRQLAGKQSRGIMLFADPENGWESCRSQIASLLTAALSGQNFMGAAVGGSEASGSAQHYVRDLEWKTFTPLLFADGRFRDKTPFAYNKKISRINAAYLNLRQILAPYFYQLAYDSLHGDAIVRPLFWEFGREKVNYTDRVKEEFMLGPSLLVAPITSGREDGQGHSLKNNLYLPGKQTLWIDLFSGQKFAGGRAYEQLTYPLWHLPVFVRGGAILPIGERDFVFYPQKQSQYLSYQDSGYQDYRHNHSRTLVTSSLQANKLQISLAPSQGKFAGQKQEQATTLNIMCDHYPDAVSLRINGQKVDLTECGSPDSFERAHEGFFYNPDYHWLPRFANYQTQPQAALQVKLSPRDIFSSHIELTVNGLEYGQQSLVHAITDTVLHAPGRPKIDKDSITSRSFTVSWPVLTKGIQIEVNGVIHTGISGQSFTFHGLKPATRYILRLRYLAGQKVSEWSQPFGVITKEDPLTWRVKNIKTSCNYPAQPQYPLPYLLDGLNASEWHSQPVKQTALTLTFTFPQKENLSRMVYVPRAIDKEGLITSLKIEVSADGQNFKSYQDQINWKDDSKNKVVGMRQVQAQAVRLTVLGHLGETVSGKEILFFKQK